MTRVLIVLIVLFISSCKKEKPAAVKTSNNGSLAYASTMLAKINGVGFEVPQDGFTIGKSSLFSFKGQTSLSEPYSAISFSMALNTTTGVSTFNQTTFIGTLRDSLGITFAAKSGTINITAIDTFGYGIKKLKANFSFLTDTVGGKTYNVSNGAIDFKL